MSQSIIDLVKTLRDAATSIEKASRFSLGEDVDLADAIKLIQLLKPDASHASFSLTIQIPYGKTKEDEPPTVSYEIQEGYSKKASAESFKACLEAYAAAKEGVDSLASVGKLVKKACRIDAGEAVAAEVPAEDVI